MSTYSPNQNEMESSIQEMVKTTVHEIPVKYLVNPEPAINPNNSLPNKNPNSPSSISLPIIDMETFRDEANKSPQIDMLHSIFKDWGVFQLVNHGVDTTVLEKAKREIEAFYELPLEDRLRYKIRPGDVEGYGQTILHSADQKVDWADRFYIITNPISLRKPHLFPQLPVPLREALEAYLSELVKVTRELVGLIAESLKVDKRELQEVFEDGMQSIRINYYPPCPEPDKVIGLTPHSDACGVTLLLQLNGVQGFQIKKDGVWMPVEFLPNAFVVTLGDVSEIISNGLYKSVEHRAVVNSDKERISIAMFFSPKYEAQVGPLPSLLINRPPIFRTLGVQQYVQNFFSQKLNGKTFLDYMKL